jgi:hypothetical protein
MKVRLELNFTVSSMTEPIELPEGKTWANVKHSEVVMDTLYLTFDDGTSVGLHAEVFEAPIGYDYFQNLTSYTVYPVDDDDDPIEDHPLEHITTNTPRNE